VSAVERGQRLGPGKGGLFPLGKIFDHVEHDNAVEPLIGFAVLARFAQVIRDAMRTAVQL
jgi:hypothetical protein